MTIRRAQVVMDGGWARLRTVRDMSRGQQQGFCRIGGERVPVRRIGPDVWLPAEQTAHQKAAAMVAARDMQLELYE